MPPSERTARMIRELGSVFRRRIIGVRIAMFALWPLAKPSSSAPMRASH